ncbi:PIN domain-containing protein [Caballeronia sp. ATUFL_M2_KS44]|uniref:PIN domain-containing protein n=1 Tax=Caballeronia sp. ATUFL_M2_KS44 TaxID=2921767 RepID=UPI00202912B3|nr:PIN domain-containing protein [Caballeronia sp. ATUFL_M2_KS44]
MTKLNLFIDTNILLNFYSFSDDELEVIDELIAHIGGDQIALHLPAQVENEFERNRESKLRTAVLDFKNSQFPMSIPNVMKGTETAVQYEQALKNAQIAKKALIANVTGLAHERELNVDKKIAALFEKATRHPEDADSYEIAIARMNKGNPPGKPDSLGDRYNWEILLKYLPNDDLFIVSKDGDFASPLSSIDKSVVRPMAFLASEWAQKKDGASLYIFTTIKSVVEHYKKLLLQPAVQGVVVEIIAAADQNPVQPPPHAAEAIVDENVVEAQDRAGNAEEAVNVDPQQQALIAQKDAALKRLCESVAFAETHLAVAQLMPFRRLLTKDDATRLFEAAIGNTQIGWIITDSDVYDLFVSILNEHMSDVDGGLIDAIIDLLGLTGPEQDTAPADTFGDSHLI